MNEDVLANWGAVVQKERKGGGHLIHYVVKINRCRCYGGWFVPIAGFGRFSILAILKEFLRQANVPTSVEFNL